MIYGTRTNGGLHGTVYTKKEVVDAMLDLSGYKSNKNLSQVRLVDPASGEGVFLMAAIERLFESSKRYAFSFTDALDKVRAYEIDPEKCEIIRGKLAQFFHSKKHKFQTKVLTKIVLCEDFLLCNDKADLIIGNPPYVRHEKIPQSEKALYKTLFETFSHRSDLYVCFYEKGLRLLSKKGQLCFICSNRWLKNQYGKKLRRLVSDKFDFSQIVNLENVDAFEESVIAYPAITLIKNEIIDKADVIKFIEVADISELNASLLADTGTLVKISENGMEQFSGDSSDERAELFSIEQQGFKIGIGVATGADSIFISKEFPKLLEKEVILPIATSKDLRTGKFIWGENYIINPYASGTHELVNLNDFPMLRDYFNLHKSRLAARHTAKGSNSRWYKTIDRIYPDLVKKPKLLLPDFGTKQQVFIEKGKYYPHHNLYFITGKNIEALLTLGAILKSVFVRDQMNLIGNKMNGGYVRWQSQNLRKLKIPLISSIAQDHVRLLQTAFSADDVDSINAILEYYFNNKNEPQLRDAI